MELDSSRFLGAFMGSIVGDALGAPFEFMSPGSYTRQFPEPVLGGTGEMVGGGSFQWAPGEFTDDTQMGLVLATSLLHNHRLIGQDIFSRFRVWARHANDVGIQTRSVLSSSQPWDKAALQYYRAHPHSAAGNGALMRTVPVALYFSDGSLEQCMDAGRFQANLTHGDPAVSWGTALYHGLIYHALRGVDPFSQLPSLLNMLPAEVRPRYEEMLSPRWHPSQTSLPNGTVWTCLAQAVWAVRTTTSFEQALVEALNLGNDTDTVGAVTGGLAGALYGIQRIPSRWTTYLNGKVQHPEGLQEYDLSELLSLGNQLLGIEAPLPPMEPILPLGEIDTGILASNLNGMICAPRETAIISLSRTFGRVSPWAYRRQFYLLDSAAAASNPDVQDLLLELVRTVEAFRKEGRQVLIHCHAGRSRTGLALRAWLMYAHGWTEAQARAHVEARWPYFQRWNPSFEQALQLWEERLPQLRLSSG